MQSPPASDVSPETGGRHEARPADSQPRTACAASCATDAPTPRIGLDELLAQKPRSGMFLVDGWVQFAHHCGECPSGASCKPCEEGVMLSAVRGAYKDPLSAHENLVVEVADARGFELFGHYRVTVAVCARTTDDAPMSAAACASWRIP